MANLAARVNAELENIKQVLQQLPPAEKLAGLSQLELAGVAALLHNFYNGIENILKQIVRERGLTIPGTSNWHRDLLDLAVKNKVIDAAMAESLSQYLGFRHFFSHGYALDLDHEKMRPLVKSVKKFFSGFKKTVERISVK